LPVAQTPIPHTYVVSHQRRGGVTAAARGGGRGDEGRDGGRGRDDELEQRRRVGLVEVRV